MPHRLRRARSWAHALGKESRTSTKACSWYDAEAMKTPTGPLSTFPSRPSHGRCTPADAFPFWAKPEGSKTITPSGVPRVQAHLAGPFAQPRPMVPGGRADEVLEAVPFLVVAVGDGLGGLVLQVGDEPGQVGPGVVTLLPAGQALGERPGELGAAFEAALKDLRRDLALGEQRLLAEPITPVHRSPPCGTHPRRKAFVCHALAVLNRIPTAELHQ